MSVTIKQLRGPMTMANELEKAGVVFVCVPVLNDADHVQLGELAQYRLDRVMRERKKESRRKEA